MVRLFLPIIVGVGLQEDQEQNKLPNCVSGTSQPYNRCFDVLLTVHLSIFILVIKIALHSLWYHHTYRCDDTRGCVMQF